ncbi:MAG: response regulator transcription factor [Bacteroidota bacterium]
MTKQNSEIRFLKYARSIGWLLSKNYRMNILLFDDDPFIINLLKTNLIKSVGDVTIFTSLNYEDSVKIVKENKIDIALIDLNMPEKNGADFIDYLNSQARYKDIRKVVLTSTGKKSILKTSFEQAVDAYLFKNEVFENFDLVLDQLKFVN